MRRIVGVIAIVLSVVAVLAVVVWATRQTPQASGLEGATVLPSAFAVVPAPGPTLLHTAYHVHDTSRVFCLWTDTASSRRFWISGADFVVPLTDIYPSFSGTPIGLVVFDNTIAAAAPNQYRNVSFLVVSTDGHMYNPKTISAPWKSTALYLPTEDCFAMSASPTATPASSSLWYPGLRMRFAFHRPPGVFVVDEGTPVASGGAWSSVPATWTMPSVPANTMSLAWIGQNVLAVDGTRAAYALSGDEWRRVSDDIARGRVQTTVPSFVNRTFSATPTVLGAEYDDGTPTFLVASDDGTYYMMDREGRTYNLAQLFFTRGVPAFNGTVIDIAKIGPGVYDYVVACNDGQLYSPRIPGGVLSIRAVCESVGWPYSLPSSITHTISRYLGTDVYALVLLFPDGQWFSTEYNTRTNALSGRLVDSSLTAPRWKDWIPTREVDLPGARYKVSSFRWAVFVLKQPWDQSVVYLLDAPGPTALVHVFHCTDDFGAGCVGVQAPPAVYTRPNYATIPGKGIRATPAMTLQKVSFRECIDTAYPVVEYDSLSATCKGFVVATSDDAYGSSTATTYVRVESLPEFHDKFCVYHPDTRKYMYFDSDANVPKLHDECLYTGAYAHPVSAEMSARLARSMASVWRAGPDGSYLQSANDTIAGFLHYKKRVSLSFWERLANGVTKPVEKLANVFGASVSIESDSLELTMRRAAFDGFRFEQGAFTDGARCLAVRNNNVVYVPCGEATANEKTFRKVLPPCPTADSDSFVYEFCM